MTVTWDKSDVPAVDAGELLAAAQAWIGESGRSAITLATVDGRRIDTERALERCIADSYGRDTNRSLAIILRLRCLQAALACRRFQPFVKGGDEAWLTAAAAAAAGMRVNADIGFSPVRLAWTIAAQAEAMRAAGLSAAA